MTPWADLEQLTDELMVLLQESAAFHRDQPDVSTMLHKAWSVAASIRRRLEAGRDRYLVALVGLSNVGKSTLLNALFGLEVAPRRNGPCTALPIEFVHGSAWQLQVAYRGDFSRQTVQCTALGELHERLDGLANDASDGSARQIEKLSVAIEHPLLATGLSLADTPGFGAAQLGEAAGTHESALVAYLRRDVGQVFWVTLAEQGIGNRELAFYREYLADLCDDVVVTGCEEWDDRDAARFRRRFEKLFGRREPQFHFVSSLDGTGIAQLRARLGHLADAKARFAAVGEALEHLARDLGQWLRAYRDHRGQRLPAAWRSDSWLRFETATRSTFTRLVGNLRA